MSNDVLITPASRKIEFKDSSANVDAKIETDASGNLLITNTGGDISIGDTSSDIFVGDGTNNIDIVFEQDGEIRGTSGVTITLGQSDSSIRMATDLNLNSNDITNVGDLTVTGNLTITGDINSYNVTDLDVSDKTITLGVGQTEANSGSSGIIIDGSAASMLWDEGDNRFEFNKNIYAPVIYGSGAGITSLNGSNISSGTVAAARIANLDTSKITSGLLGGARIATGTSGDWWSGNAVKVGTDGVMEIGKYIDFHNADAGTSDYTARITNTGDHLYATGRVYVNANQRVFADDYHPNADTLTTARTIAGTSFNGSANIDISYNNLTNKPTIPSVSGLAPIASPTFTGTVTTPNLTIGSGNKIKFANNDHIRYDDTANRFHFDADGGSSNASVQAVTFVGALSGNATTATTLATARTISLGGDVTGSVSFNGSSNVTITTTVNDDSHFHHRLDSTDDRDMKPNTSGIATSVQALKPFFSSYGGMTGTANTAYVDVLAFDTYADSSGGGPSAITFKKGNSAGNPEMHIWKAGWNATTWSTGQRVFADNYHPNADTLTTARTINGVSFNGSANITVADSTKLPLAGGTLTGALNAGGGINGLTLSNGISGSNFNITGVNVLTINDPGEGIEFGGGSTAMSLAIVDDATDRILRYSGTGAVFDVQGNITLTGTVDGVDIASRNSVLTSTTTTANAALPKAGGTMTGQLVVTAGGNQITINGSAPTMLFNDTSGEDNFYLHVNSNRFYVLTDRDGTGGYESPHPLELNASNNIGYAFGSRLFTEAYHPNADTWTTARTITLGGDLTGNVSINGSANVTLTAAVVNDSHTHDGRYFTETETNNLLAARTPLDHFRSLGVPAFTGTATTAGYISEMESDGAFDSYTSAFKTTWSYAGNFNISDAGTYGPTETAGMSHLTWTDNSSDSARGNITVLAIAPNTGGSAGRTFIYNDQGASYGPGWREIWTSRRMGAGTGLDADLLDAQQGSYYLDYNNFTNTPTAGDITSVGAGTGLTGGGTSGAVTLNVIGGAGITANANDIAVDSTVIRTTGDQSMSGIKTHTSRLALSAGQMLSLGDTNHHLVKVSTGYSGVTIDGPRLQGHQGGELATNISSNQYAMRWDASGNIVVRGDGFFNGSKLEGDGKEMIRYNDSWLRLNPANEFTSGIYCGTGKLRTDGQLEVGGNGSAFKATTAGAVTAAGSMSAASYNFLANTTANYNGYNGVPLVSGVNGAAYYHGSDNGGYGIVIQGGHPICKSVKIGSVNAGTTVIDASRNITAVDGTFTGNVYGRSVNAAHSALYRFGGIYFTWDSDSYGTNPEHCIRSTDGNTYGDHITLNSFGNVRINFDSNSNGTNYFRIGHATTGTANVLLTLDESGNGTFAGNVTAYSDIRLKENIVDVDNALNKVCSLRGVYYNMIADETKSRRLGLVAQEVEKVLPEVVIEAHPEDDKDSILSVDYGNMVALLIEGMKEQQETINKLTSRINDIEKGEKNGNN